MAQLLQVHRSYSASENGKVHTFKGYLIFDSKIEMNSGSTGTLCQVSGCGACAANDPSIHSTEDIPFGDTRFKASPFSPTYFGVESEEKVFRR